VWTNHSRNSLTRCLNWWTRPTRLREARNSADMPAPCNRTCLTVARCAGRISSDSISEKASTAITTTAAGIMNRPIMPSTVKSGAKAVTVVRTAKRTGQPTSSTPRVAAACGPSPRSRRAKTLSPTTMASSTTMPSERMKAKSEIMLRVTPNQGSTQKPPKKLIRMPSETQKASRSCMLRASTRKTRPRPINPFLSSRFMRSR